jgi:hypothetical protein
MMSPALSRYAENSRLGRDLDRDLKMCNFITRWSILFHNIKYQNLSQHELFNSKSPFCVHHWKTIPVNSGSFTRGIDLRSRQQEHIELAHAHEYPSLDTVPSFLLAYCAIPCTLEIKSDVYIQPIYSGVKIRSFLLKSPSDFSKH